MKEFTFPSFVWNFFKRVRINSIMENDLKNGVPETAHKEDYTKKDTNDPSDDVKVITADNSSQIEIMEEFPLCVTLRKAKKLQNLTVYCKVIVAELDKEASSLFKSVFFFLLYCVMLITGVHHEVGRGVACKSDPLLAVCLIQSGILGVLVNAINISDTFFGVISCYVDKCRKIFHIILFINNNLGLFHLYSLWKPDVVNEESDNYCQFHLFWVAFFTLHCASILYVFMIFFTFFCICYYCCL